MSRTSRVFDSLYSRESSSNPTEESVETTAVDDDTITETVREAVAEHERTFHDAEDPSVDDPDGAERSVDSGRSPVRVLGVAAVLALLGYLARKRRRGPDGDRDATDGGESVGSDDR